MAPIQLTAIITPKPGKAQRNKFLDLFEACFRYVQANEPYIHRYELHKGIKDLNEGKEQFVVLEGYDDQEALDQHMKTPPVVEMMRALEKEDLTETTIIRTTTEMGIKAKI
ncbi:Fc.00g109610.m01.CDS01 [Cosmosporella sp. VM-42]